MKLSKGFPFYGVTFYLCRFCTCLNSAQLASWAKLKKCAESGCVNVTPEKGNPLVRSSYPSFNGSTLGKIFHVVLLI